MGGEENLALYGYAYTPYTIMLSIAAAGVPGAVSKYVSKYNIAELQMLAAGDGAHRWSTEDVTRIIRVVSVAVIVVPFMATWRGIFQGFESFGPTSVSAVIEQLSRIVFLLGGAFIVIYISGISGGNGRGISTA